MVTLAKAATHLAAAIRELLPHADEERIRTMQRDRWIDYGKRPANTSC